MVAGLGSCRGRPWLRNEAADQPSQVLGGGSEEHPVVGAGWTAQPGAGDPEDALQVRDRHLHVLVAASRLGEGVAVGAAAGDR